jgi:hypothetical protein
VHVGRQVGEHRRGRVGEVVENLDPAALLGDEDAPVRRELQIDRRAEPAEDDLLLEAGRQRDRGRGR